MITLRGLILGRIVDYECAEALAERLARSEAANGAAFVARARIRATFHLFADALNDLDVAEWLSPNVETINIERAAIFQGLGRYDEALAIRQGAADRRSSFETLGALAWLCAELGEIEAGVVPEDLREVEPLDDFGHRLREEVVVLHRQDGQLDAG